MKFKHIFYCLLSLMPALVLSGCFDSQQVDVELPQHESRPVINAYLHADSLPRVYIRQSQGLNERIEEEFITDAEVELRDGEGRLLENLVARKLEDSSYYTSPATRLEAGRIYQISCTLSNGRKASGKTWIPAPVAIGQINYNPNGATSVDGYTMDEVEIEWNDPAGARNFYFVHMEMFTNAYYDQDGDGETDTISRRYFIYPEAQLANVTESAGGLLLSDEGFDGKKITLKAQFSNWYGSYGWGDEEPRDSIAVYLSTLSETAYDYLRKYEDHLNSQSVGFFATEPVVMYNNVDGGYGIVGGLSQMAGSRKKVAVAYE